MTGKAALRYAAEHYRMELTRWSRRGREGPAPTFEEAMRWAARVYWRIPQQGEDGGDDVRQEEGV